MFKDYYGILGVSPHASGEQIKFAYRKMALLCHPDRFASTNATETSYLSSFNQQHNHHDAHHGSTLPSGSSPSVVLEADAPSSPLPFTEVQEAYEVLSEVARRYLYDLNYNEMRQQQQRVMEEMERRQRENERLAQLEMERERHRVLLQQEQLAKTSTAVLDPHSSFSMQAAERTVKVSEMTKEAGMKSARGQKEKARAEVPAERRVEEMAPAGAGMSHSSGSDGAEATQTLEERQVPPQPPPFRRTTKKKKVAAPRPSPPLEVKGRRPSKTPGHLPSIHPARVLDLSFDPNTTASVQRGYPMMSAAAMGLPSDYFVKRSFDRTMRVFFPNEQAMLGGLSPYAP